MEKMAAKSTVKKTQTNKRGVTPKKDNRSSGGKDSKPSFAYQLIPYIVAVVALFLLICFISNAICNPKNTLYEQGRESEHALGIVGFWVCQIMFGVFGPAAYLIPLILACFVIFWKNYNSRNFVAINAIIALLTAIVLSALFHTFLNIGDGVDGFSSEIDILFEEGAGSSGGGVIGGILAFALSAILNIGGTIFVLVAVLIPMITFLVGTTPVAVVTKIVAKIKEAREEGADDREERKKERAIEKKEKQKEKALERKERKAEQELEEKERRESERLQRAALLEEERARKEEENSKAAAKRSEITEDDEAVDFGVLDGTNEADRSADEAEINEEPEEKVKYSALTVNEIRRIDSIKNGESKYEKPVQDDEDDDMDEDERGADAVFSSDNHVDDKNEDGDSETIVFSDRNDSGKRERGHSKVDDMASELFDQPEEHYEVDKETGEVFVPVVQDKGFKSADEYRAANEVKDEYFIGEKPEPAPIPEYVFPPIDLLEDGPNHYSTSEDEIEKNTQLLREVLGDFRIPIRDIECSCGPTITRYEIKPEAGVRVRQIANLVDDISLALAKSGVRIEAPIPGKAAVGIEVPNDKSVPVKLRTLIETPEFIGHKSKLASCLGADVSGKPVVFDIEKMPHLLVAGTTGSGKSVCINSIIMSILYHAKPEEVKLLLIDPKKVEFKVYKDIPHLCCRIVSDPKKAAGALNTAVNEMEKRFELIEEVGVRNITGYNEATKNDPDKPYMPRMVIIIDEFADLMMTAKDEVETAVVRIAQKARAAGIHLIIGTQRPSVDVITGLIKANIPSRIAFTVMSQVDSRTILDGAGAEKLCGRGDMLYAPVGAQKPQRVQGAFVSDEEVETVVTYVKEHNAPVRYDQEFETSIDNEAAKCGNAPESNGSAPSGGSSGGDEDTKFWDAVELAIDAGKISTSLLQRRLEVGYGRAAKIIDRMEEMGFVSAPDGNKPRKILITREELEERRLNEE
ncbi:MAG: DNA translocase FtsK [Ruminococcaceae bacterium]|nr:DNA translocase FtsK [Oscillospiraceae bacterium]